MKLHVDTHADTYNRYIFFSRTVFSHFTSLLSAHAKFDWTYTLNRAVRYKRMQLEKYKMKSFLVKNYYSCMVCIGERAHNKCIRHSFTCLLHSKYVNNIFIAENIRFFCYTTKTTWITCLSEGFSVQFKTKCIQSEPFLW